MILMVELTVNPGAKTLFSAEVRLERNIRITPKWWALWLGWWLYRPTHWREWLYGWEHTNEGGLAHMAGPASRVRDQLATRKRYGR